MRDQSHRLELDSIAYLLLQATNNTWYPEGFMQPLVRNEPALSHALEVVDKAVNLCIEKAFGRERTALVGFSQGACLATEYLGRNPGRYGALIAWTGGRLGPTSALWNEKADYLSTPMFFGIGSEDPWVPLNRVTETADWFRAHGAHVVNKTYADRSHHICDDEIASARAILKMVGIFRERRRDPCL